MESIKKDCKALQDTLECCNKPVIANYDKQNHYYNIKCRICDKEIKSPSLTNIIFGWLKK